MEGNEVGSIRRENEQEWRRRRRWGVENGEEGEKRVCAAV